jgi:hypothetical protein
MTTIDEQIAHQKSSVEAAAFYGDEPAIVKEKAILASLEEFKRIHEAEMPVEPDRDMPLIDYIDTLKLYAQRMAGEADGQFQYAGRLLDQLHTAEREKAALIAENEGLRKDAERYRWLRDTADRDNDGHCYIAQDDWIGEGEGDDAGDEGVVTHWLQKDEADAAIGNAMDEGRGNE